MTCTQMCFDLGLLQFVQLPQNWSDLNSLLHSALIVIQPYTIN